MYSKSSFYFVLYLVVVVDLLAVVAERDYWLDNMVKSYERPFSLSIAANSEWETKRTDSIMILASDIRTDDERKNIRYTNLRAWRIRDLQFQDSLRSAIMRVTMDSNLVKEKFRSRSLQHLPLQHTWLLCFSGITDNRELALADRIIATQRTRGNSTAICMRRSV